MPQKPSKKYKLAASDVQKEAVELEPVQILNKRTRCGGSDRASLVKTVKKPLNQTKRIIRKLKLPLGVEEEESREGVSLMSQVVEEKHLEAAQHVLKLTKELSESTLGQASEVLKTHMEIKTEQGTSDASRPKASKGNHTHSSPSKPIDLDSSLDSGDELPLSQRYTKLQKRKPPY
jgi:hypothetical protein